MERPKSITVITYPVSHRKTHDLLFGLIANGISDVRVISVPYTYVKKTSSLVAHRPAPLYDVDAESLCRVLGLDYHKWPFASYEGIEEKINGDLVLIGGATILPPKLVEAKVILNSHPGMIPFTRGLDAVKWAIWKGEDVGVTVHRVRARADYGPIYLQELVAPQPMDSFDSLARRAYEVEIRLLVEATMRFDKIEPRDPPDILSVIDGSEHPVNKRMPRRVEAVLPQVFEQWKLRKCREGVAQ